MIKENTVLVLGAGASMDYGFPSGRELIQDIVNLIEGTLLYGKPFIAKIYLALLVCRYYKLKGTAIPLTEAYTAIDEFHSTFVKASPASIDDFLHNISKTNPIYVVVGKLCITILISRHENESKNYLTNSVDTDKRHRYYKELESIYKNDDELRNIWNKQVTLSGLIPKSHYVLADGWYEYLWEKIYKGNIEQNLRKITIITFNYDRSLEQFLHTRIMNLHGLTTEESASLLNNNLKIHHVYGKIGCLPWSPSDNKSKLINPYEPFNIYEACKDIEDYTNTAESMEEFVDFLTNKVTEQKEAIDIIKKIEKGFGFQNQMVSSFNSKADVICAAIDNIKTYTENADAFDSFLIKKLSWAKRLFFLGFGYNPRNIELLKPKKNLLSVIHTIAGTTYGFGAAQINDAVQNITKTFHGFFYIDRSPYFQSQYSEYKIKEYFMHVLDL
ncbi:MAG TPA: hypothetical protein DCS13_08120 [Candidatus Margulisbacteria bacterium]|nr:MAG: hypothetical protein A2X43_14050 [Candidatus Margulisbacteria bacterium GWD2_39_127]HAR63413.1 hypothetical protein [Candidatus Margulisiibacteriota bacterium]